MSYIRKSVKSFVAILTIFCLCILTACSISGNLHSTENTSSSEEKTTKPTSEDTSSNYISITSETTPTTTETPEPHEASWLDPTDPELYNFTTEQKQVYCVMMEGIKHNISTIAMPCKISYDEVAKIFNLVRNNLYEYCNLILDYTNKMNSSNVTSILVEYKYDAQQVQDMKDELSEKADSILSNFYEGMPEWDKIKYIHDYIVLNCTYDTQAPNSQSAYGALIDGKAVCEGYAKAMAYLCNKAGIECMLVTGYAGGDAHMWNLVKYNGNWYHTDVTWDDPAKPVFDSEYVKYKYFNLTNSQIRLDHKIIPDNNFFEYPEAIANEGNYYIKKDAYIKTFDEARKILIKQIATCVDNNLKYVSVKVATQTLYNDIVRDIANANDLSNILNEANDISGNRFNVADCKYYNDENGYIISIYIKELSPSN